MRRKRLRSGIFGQKGEVRILPILTDSSASLVAGLAETDPADVSILVPCFEALTPALADIAGLLPIRAANAALLRHLAETAPARLPVIAGILSVDPFLNGASLYRRLAACGITAVVNLPSVAMADGALQKALAMAGLDAVQELRALARARDHGLEPVAMVFSRSDALQAADLGLRRVLLHPGLPHGDAARDRWLAKAAVATLGQLRREGFDALLYRHPDLAAWLPDDDKGQLRWGVEAPSVPQARS